MCPGIIEGWNAQRTPIQKGQGCLLHLSGVKKVSLKRSIAQKFLHDLLGYWAKQNIEVVCCFRTGTLGMKNFQVTPTKQEEVLLLWRFFSKFPTSSSFFIWGSPIPFLGQKEVWDGEGSRANSKWPTRMSKQKECDSRKQGTQHNWVCRAVIIFESPVTCNLDLQTVTLLPFLPNANKKKKKKTLLPVRVNCINYG